MHCDPHYRILWHAGMVFLSKKWRYGLEEGRSQRAKGRCPPPAKPECPRPIVFIQICQFCALHGQKIVFFCLTEVFCDPKICQKCVSGGAPPWTPPHSAPSAPRSSRSAPSCCPPKSALTLATAMVWSQAKVPVCHTVPPLPALLPTHKQFSLCMLSNAESIIRLHETAMANATFQHKKALSQRRQRRQNSPGRKKCQNLQVFFGKSASWTEIQILSTWRNIAK